MRLSTWPLGHRKPRKQFWSRSPNSGTGAAHILVRPGTKRLAPRTTGFHSKILAGRRSRSSLLLIGNNSRSQIHSYCVAM